MSQTPVPSSWPSDVKTLSIDVGGSGLKGSVLDAEGQMLTERVRIETPYPCTPEVLVKNLLELGQATGSSFDRVSVGFPGLVRDGKVVYVTAFVRREYGGEPDAELTLAWDGYDLATALADGFGVPVKVANDADMQGCAVAQGDGFEFVMTLGTGCGTAVFNNGKLLPHMELSHAPFQKGETFDQQLGNAARDEIGNKKWRKRVRKAIPAFERFLFFDHIYVGGGNAKHTKPEDLGPKATVVPNTAGILGGIRIWDLDA